MWFWLMIGSALAGKWDGVNGDVVAQRTIAATPAQVYALVSDLRVFSEVFSEDCADEWVLGAQTAGQGARMTVRYDISMMRRRLPAVISAAQPDRVVDIDHEGKRGFVSRFELAPAAGGGTLVTFTTFLTPPPRPFQGMYFNKVQPAWATCQDATLTALAARLP